MFRPSVLQIGTLAAVLVAFGAAQTVTKKTQVHASCPCIGSNGQQHTAPNGGVMTTKKFGTATVGTEYAADYGEFCGAHAEPGPESCTAAVPEKWCSNEWCYVDPCFCDGPTDMGESDYFATTISGAKLFYSYEACGSADLYNSHKCPLLDKATCTDAEHAECVWSDTDSKCSVSTTNVETTRTANECSKLNFGTYGTACRCLGNNLQQRGETNGVGHVMATLSKLNPKEYPESYGQSCKTHAEPGNSDCTDTANPPDPNFVAKAWCASPWCYVDPCECTVDTHIGESDYFATTATGAKLFYSYAACGSDATYSLHTCDAFTDATTCNAADECTFDTTTNKCAIDKNNIVKSRTTASCSPLTGNSDCPCSGTNGQAEVQEGTSSIVLTTRDDFKGHKYPGNYGEQCSAHAEPGSPACQGNYPSAWCTHPWCYVDPCTCSDKAVGNSDYFKTTESGKPLHYSYASCGSADAYNHDKCTDIMTEAFCVGHDECLYAAATSACGKKSDNLEAARAADGGCGSTTTVEGQVAGASGLSVGLSHVVGACLIGLIGMKDRF